MDAARFLAAPRGPAVRVRRGARRVLTLGVLVPSVALVLAGPALADVSAVSGAASGISVATTGLLAVTVANTPSVTLPIAGSAVPLTATTAAVNAAPLVNTGVLTVSTKGTTGNGGSVTSSATVNSTSVAGVLAANLLGAGVITSSCLSNESGSTGMSSIANLTALGMAVPVTGAPNQVVNVAGLGTLHINEQIVTGSGSSTAITVNALRLSLAIPAVVTGDVIIAQSQCGVTGNGVSVPTGAIGGVLLAGLVAVGFVGVQLRRRRRPGDSAV